MAAGDRAAWRHTVARPRSAEGLGDPTAGGGAACPAKGSRGGSKPAGRHLAGRRAAPIGLLVPGDSVLPVAL